MKLENEIIQKERDSTREMEQKSQEMKSMVFRLDKEKQYWKENLSDQISQIQTIATEKSIGFPWLAKAYSDFFYLHDMRIAEKLEFEKDKKAEGLLKIKEIALARRNAEEKLRLFQYLLEFYECLFPWLAEFRESATDEFSLKEEFEIPGGYKIDPVLALLSEEEIQSLNTLEQKQAALERFLQKRDTKWKRTQDFERALCFPFLRDGWNVQFYGLIPNFPDLMRLMVGKKREENGEKTMALFCRSGSDGKELNVKLVNLVFFAALEQAKPLLSDAEPSLDLQKKLQSGEFSISIFSTGPCEADVKAFARLLGITIHEHHPLESFPPIRGYANAQTGEKRYYLPFDYEYDGKHLNETFVQGFQTVPEAEAQGFTRIFSLPEIQELVE
jgi:hypothetical protein